MENRKHLGEYLDADLEWEMLTLDAADLILSQNESIALLQGVTDGAVAASAIAPMTV